MALDWEEPHFSNPESPFIPPLEVRTYDLHKKGRLPTPVDKVTGLVDKRALVNLVINTVVPGYDWTSSHVPNLKTTRHHLLWPHAWYAGYEDLRNHGSLSSKMPRIAHNWAHEVTYPALPPSLEVSHEYVEARNLSDGMRTLAGHPAFLAKETLRINHEVFGSVDEESDNVLRGEIAEDKQIDLARQLEVFSKLFEAAKAGPKEFQVIDYAAFELNNVNDMLRIAHRIARHAVDEAAIDRGLIQQEDEKIAA